MKHFHLSSSCSRTRGKDNSKASCLLKVEGLGLSVFHGLKSMEVLKFIFRV